MTAATEAAQSRMRLRPYVSGLALQWLETAPSSRHRSVHGSLVFVDISGFTALTERLASKGKVGAEEMSDLLDATFARLLSEAYGYGASLVKWGGDAVLLLFEDDEHALLACRAAYEMRRTMRRIGRLHTSVGTVQLRMSVGVNSGEFDFFMTGRRHHELLVAGPAATATALMEQTAEAGEIVVTEQTAAMLPPSCVGEHKGDGLLLRAAPRVAQRSRAWVPSPQPADPGACLDPAIREQLLTEVGDSEHRQVGVGFVEVSGVDDLLQRQGPGAVASALDDLMVVVQEECAHHAVTFWETDISVDGFKIMLVSGAPRSTGHDEEGMLRAARAILDRHDGRVRVRIGVNCGRVFSGGFGPRFRRTWSVKGDAVNLAARVMGKAGPGQLVATEALLSRVACTVDAEPLPPFMVKGKRQPVRAALVRAVMSQQASSSGGTFVGRARELDALMGARRAAASGHGQALALIGQPGIGKSHLVDQACSRFPAGTVVLRSFADAYESATPFYAVRRLLRAALRLEPDATDERVVRRLEHVMRRHAPHVLPWLPLLVVPFGAYLPETAATSEIQEQFRPNRTQSLVLEFLAATCTGTTVFVVDDVHSADDASLALLSRLAAEAETNRWLVVVAGRELPPSLSNSAVREMRLAPLEPEDVAALVFEHPGGEGLSPHVLRAIIERGQGNPLFVKELAAAAASSQGDELPATLEETLAAQIDALGPAERKLLRTVAVLGARFEEALAVQLLDERPTSEQWRALEHFLALHADGSRRFRTTLARDAAYEGLPFRVRVDLHGRAAAALEARTTTDDDAIGALSLHCLAAGRYDDAWRYSLRAADRASRMYANVEALTFLERARAASRHTRRSADDVAALMKSIGDLHARLAEFPDALTAYAASRRSAPRDAHLLRADVAVRAATVTTRAGQLRRTMRWFAAAERDLDLAASGAQWLDPLVVSRARVTVERAMICYRQGRYREARALAERALLPESTPEAAFVLGRALHTLEIVDQALGCAPDEARLLRARRLFESCGDLIRQAAICNELGVNAYFAGAWDVAVQCYEEARALDLRAGDDWNAAIATKNIAEVLVDQGHLDRAEPMLVGVLREIRASGAPGYQGAMAMLLGRLRARAGRFDDAVGLLDEALAAFAANGEPFEALDTELQIVELLILQGRAQDALQRLADLERRRRRLIQTAGAPDVEDAFAIAALRWRGYASGQLGDDAAAAANFERSLRLARELGTLHDEALALAGMAWSSADPAVIRERDALFDQLQIAWTPDVPSVAVISAVTLELPRQRGAARAGTQPPISTSSA